jgi:hypothetical protein
MYVLTKSIGKVFNISAANAFMGIHLKTRKHHRPIHYIFCDDRYNHRTHWQLPKVPQRSTFPATPAKNVVMSVQNSGYIPL